MQSEHKRPGFVAGKSPPGHHRCFSITMYVKSRKLPWSNDVLKQTTSPYYKVLWVILIFNVNTSVCGWHCFCILTYFLPKQKEQTEHINHNYYVKAMFRNKLYRQVTTLGCFPMSTLAYTRMALFCLFFDLLCTKTKGTEGTYKSQL